MMKVKLRFRALGLFLLVLVSSNTVLADITLHVGPVAGGAGGPNPISIPPTNFSEYEIVWVTKADSEYTLGVIPGIFYGKRFRSSYAYVSAGGGLVIGFNGIGPGIYTAYGIDLCSVSFCFNLEYKRALGFTSKSLLSPYALRVGLTWKS